MPIVARSPARLTHSWLGENRRLFGSMAEASWDWGSDHLLCGRSGLGSLVEGEGDDLGRFIAASDVDGEPGPGRGGRRVDERHGEAPLEGRGERAGGDDTDLHAFAADLAPLAGDPFAVEAKADAGQSRVRLECAERLATDELAFFQLH